jgi:glyceraldehyde-3-phosphate dehydrogenase/erythrose-4-phosphate dehydrogenase
MLRKARLKIAWKAHEVDVVLECTGFFTDKDNGGSPDCRSKKSSDLCTRYR